MTKAAHQRKRHLKFYNLSSLILISICFSCNIKENTKDSKRSCYCDSTYTNKKNDSIFEMLCYKGEIVYKYTEKGSTLKISRHSLNDPRYLYEVCEIIKSKDTISSSNFIRVFTKRDSIVINSFATSDSIKLELIEKNEKGIYNFTTSSNSIVLHMSYFDNDYKLKLTQYKSIKSLDGYAISTFNINYSSLKYLRNNTIDSVLFKIKKCF